MYHTAIKHDVYLRTLGKCKKRAGGCLLHFSSPFSVFCTLIKCTLQQGKVLLMRHEELLNITGSRT